MFESPTDASDQRHLYYHESNSQKNVQLWLSQLLFQPRRSGGRTDADLRVPVRADSTGQRRRYGAAHAPGGAGASACPGYGKKPHEEGQNREAGPAGSCFSLFLTLLLLSLDVFSRIIGQNVVLLHPKIKLTQNKEKEVLWQNLLTFAN